METIDEQKELVELNNSEFEGDDVENNNWQGPFDPNDIDVDISVVNLGSLLEQLEYEEIDLKPEFQRSSDVWTTTQKSRLIESVLLGLPLPSFYFSEDSNTGKLMIVDGLQRLSAFKDFWVSKTLILQNLQFLPYLEGKSVTDLDRTQIRRIKSLKVTLNTLRKSTPANVKFVIFQRVNTAGVPLTAQEMRNALYQGKATELLKRMAQADSFKQATDNRVKNRRMADCDFTNRFIAFYLGKDKYEGELEPFMADALECVNKMSQSEVDAIFDAFDKSMLLCFTLLGNTAFRRPNPKGEGFLKMNKSIFDSLGVSLARLTVDEQKLLVSRKSIFVEKIHSLFGDTDFVQSVTSGTAKIPQVICRFNKINELINSVLNYDK